MRERTTWNRDQIKQAAMPKQADPYAMNQDHLSQQPPADKYLTGDPSTFAEDVTEPNTWEKEYAGGTTKRNEIGEPDFRPETFNHPEKTASDQDLLVKKASLCVAVARMMLRGRKFANTDAFEAAVEDQSVGLMHMPAADLVATADRLSNQEQFPGGEFPHEQHAAQQQDQGQDQGQQQGQQAAQQCMEAMQQGDTGKLQTAIQQMVQESMKAASAVKKAADGQQQDQQGQGQQGQQAAQQQQQNQSQGQQAAQQQQQDQSQGQQAAQQQDQSQQQGQQQAQQGQQQGQQQDQQAQLQGQPDLMQAQMQQADDVLLDDMLMGPAGDPAADMDVELEPAPMDVGEVVLSHEDEVLKTLFANEETEQAQQAQDGQGQQKQAGMNRTASTRTIGTRPTHGVSKVGGAPNVRSDNSVDKLAALWPSAPDVREAFNMR